MGIDAWAVNHSYNCKHRTQPHIILIHYSLQIILSTNLIELDLSRKRSLTCKMMLIDSIKLNITWCLLNIVISVTYIRLFTH